MSNGPVPTRIGARRALLGVLACCGILAAGPVVAAPDLTGVWMMPKGSGDARLRVPPIPAPALTPAWASRYAAEQKLAQEAEARGEPLGGTRAQCIPDGMPKMLATDMPIQIIQKLGEVTFIHEFETQVRHIDMTRRSHPAPEDQDELFFGDSIGRWEGDVLVVDTVGLKPSGLLFDDVPHSAGLHIVERFRLRSADLLEDQVTMEDSATLARPWTVVRLFQRRPDIKLREFVCAENNRAYVDEHGLLKEKLNAH